jgi:hypothetical protein
MSDSFTDLLKVFSAPGELLPAPYRFKLSVAQLADST